MKSRQQMDNRAFVLSKAIISISKVPVMLVKSKFQARKNMLFSRRNNTPELTCWNQFSYVGLQRQHRVTAYITSDLYFYNKCDKAHSIMESHIYLI